MATPQPARPHRDPAHEIHYRTCPLCEAHCGIAVEVDPAEARVVTVRGDADDPFSRGYLCPKAYGLKGLQEDPDRLRRPVARTRSGWQEIGWDEAFDRVAEGLRAVRDAHGADSVAIYLGNPTAHDLGSLIYGPAFIRALGTRWRFSATSVDQLPKMLSSALLFGGPLTIPVPDVDHTDFLLVLGANPVISNGSLMTAPDMPGRLRRLRERGGRLVVVDPRRSETAALADRHLFIRPGSDAFLLFALVNVLFEADLARLGHLEDHVKGLEEVRRLAKDFAPEAVAPVTGIAPGEVRRLARELAGARSAACYGRIGTCTQEFGTLASWLVDVLNVLTGNLDRPGGALFPRAATDPAKGERGPRKLPYARWRSRVRKLPEFNGELPVATLAEEIDTDGEDRIRALFTLAGNPVLSTPNGERLDRALASLDFVASCDLYLNETTRHADVILPPVSPLERSNYDLVFHKLSVRNTAHFSPQVLPTPPGAKQQWEILRELAARMAGAPAGMVDELLLARLLKGAVGHPNASCAEVSEEKARQALGEEPGPERILDLMLRAGPYGDHFHDHEEGEGLSLARLRKEPHGIDLGPLEPGLERALQTESGRIELAHPLLAEDTARLRPALEERTRTGSLVLIGRRQMRDNNSWMHNVRALAKGPDRCTLLVHPDDAAKHGLRDGDRASVRSRVGRVEAPVQVTEEMMPGVVSLPHGYGHGGDGTRQSVAAEHAGVNSNVLADETLLDALSCNAVLNGIPVEVEPL